MFKGRKWLNLNWVSAKYSPVIEQLKFNWNFERIEFSEQLLRIVLINAWTNQVFVDKFRIQSLDIFTANLWVLALLDKRNHHHLLRLPSSSTMSKRKRIHLKHHHHECPNQFIIVQVPLPPKWSAWKCSQTVAIFKPRVPASSVH